LPRADYSAAVEAVVTCMTKRRRDARASVFMPPTGEKALDTWLKPRREAAIAKIVQAVGKPCSDEMSLAADIYYASRARPNSLDTLDGSTAKSRLKKIRSILRAVEKQVAAINANRFIDAVINKTDTPYQLPPAQQLLSRLRRLERAEVWLAGQWASKSDVPKAMKGRRPTEREWLAGVSLPLVYERHFDARAGRSRNAEGEPSGPMVRFVQATLKELGMPNYSAESIVRAFSRLSRCRADQRAIAGGGSGQLARATFDTSK
jgi:hypothetical protein